VMRGPLPVFIEDPVARLDFVRAAMDGLKESKQAEGAATLAAVNNLAPPTVLAQASRLNFSTRLFNLIVTNIPGPQLPLYVLGRKLRDLFPVAFLPEDHALAVAIMSYDGGLDFGLLGDYDALSDIDLIAEGIDAVLAQLLAIARGQAGAGAGSRTSGASGRAATARASSAAAPPEAPRTDGTGNGRPAPIVPSGHRRPQRGPAADMRAKRQRGGPARKRGGER